MIDDSESALSPRRLCHTFTAKPTPTNYAGKTQRPRGIGTQATATITPVLCAAAMTTSPRSCSTVD
eukprot:633587-Rhodomonas_salina.1